VATKRTSWKMTISKRSRRGMNVGFVAVSCTNVHKYFWNFVKLRENGLSSAHDTDTNSKGVKNDNFKMSTTWPRPCCDFHKHLCMDPLCLFQMQQDDRIFSLVAILLSKLLHRIEIFLLNFGIKIFFQYRYFMPAGKTQPAVSNLFIFQLFC
jgi:hypothetical protein